MSVAFLRGPSAQHNAAFCEWSRELVNRSVFLIFPIWEFMCQEVCDGTLADMPEIDAEHLENEQLIARARVIRSGRTLKVFSAEVYARRNSAEMHCATMLATIMCLPGKPDRPG
jgi:hypothetical protein